MKYGITTGALYGRLETPEAIAFLRDSSICECAEIFFQCPDDYRGQYSKSIENAARGLDIVSFHMLSASLEFILFSKSKHGRAYALREISDAIHFARDLGAKRYVFHGRNRLLGAINGKVSLANPDTVAAALTPIADELERCGMVLALENVSWSEFSCPQFAPLIAAKLPQIRFTFDNKQAVRAGYDYHEYLNAMGERLDHVHVYDYNEAGHECLPGSGHIDFARLAAELRARNYDGAVIIEAYPQMFNDEQELLTALEYLKKTMG